MGFSTLKVRTYGDPILRKKSTPVKEIGPSERMVFRAMIETMHQSKGIGLAAPQVGINQRFFVADIGEGPMVVINPEFLKKSGSAVMEEGCLCLPEVSIAVTRPEKVTVQYTNENNERVKIACDGMLARVMQHETDHLDGVLITDYASAEELQRYQGQLKDLEDQQKE